MTIPLRGGHGAGTATLMLAAMWLTGATVATLQESSAPADVGVKAALLYNFAKFAEWPKLPGAAPLAACVVGDGRVADALAGIVRGKSVSGHALQVTRPDDYTAWAACNLLFIASEQLPHSALALTGIGTLPVLTVSDGAGFSRTGGIIEFYLDGGRMRFAINIDAAGRSGLQLSSRLLGLATVVRDPNAQ